MNDAFMFQCPGPGPKFFDYYQEKVYLGKKFFQFWVGPFLPIISLCHPDLAKVIMKSSEPKMTNNTGNYSVFSPWLGN